MVYQGGEVDVQWIGVSLATIIDEQGRSFTVPISRLKPIKASAPHTRTRHAGARERAPLDGGVYPAFATDWRRYPHFLRRRARRVVRKRTRQCGQNLTHRF